MGKPLKILLYNPDNGVTQNFMPHLWMFLLQSLTPAGTRGGADRRQHAADERSPSWCSTPWIRRSDLVGIGAMTRMIAKAYRVADAIRAAGVPVVMGGPHVTEVPDEALGRDGGPAPRRCHRARRSRRDLAAHRRRRRARTAQGSLHAGRRVRPGAEAHPAGLSANSLGTSSISISSTASRRSSAASCSTSARPGRPSTSSRSSPAAAARTAASSAP